MARLNIFVVGLVLALALNSVQCSDNEFESEIDVLVVPEIDDFLMNNPDVELLQLDSEVESSDPSQYTRMTYRIGQRIRGDRLLARDSGSQKFSRPNDVNTNLHYPKSGLGQVITYLEINCDQSTQLGRAYVVSGGIGQRQIAVVIEARQTLYFKYQAAIYGY